MRVPSRRWTALSGSPRRVARSVGRQPSGCLASSSIKSRQRSIATTVTVSSPRVEYYPNLKHDSNLKHNSKSVKANFEDTHEILAAERKRGTREDLQRGYRRVTPNYAATRSGLAQGVSPGRRAGPAVGRPSAETAGTVRPGTKT